MFALADCNNFYASCERIFNHSLENKPIIVLSNNDGCVISRSNEAKLLGVPMGKPFFQCKKLCKEKGIIVLSSNYQLYGDISNRVMSSLKELAPYVEIYSIDEAFLKLDKMANIDLIQYAEFIKKKIKQWVGVPISIGLGPTKVLAKVANLIAKKNNIGLRNGVFDISDVTICDKILKSLDVAEIWGIGSKMAAHLRDLDILTAYQLKNADTKFIRKIFGLVGERIVLELRGKACFDLEMTPEDKKNIGSSRSFGRPVTELFELEEALSDYSARAYQKMRNQNSKVQTIKVSIQTNYHKQQDQHYFNSSHYLFDLPVDDLCLIITKAKALLKDIYKPGLSYKKVGIMFLGLCDKNQTQGSLFKWQDDTDKDAIMNLMDTINNKIGKNTVFLAAQGTKRLWQMKSSFKSPSYTTNWNELPLAK